MKKEVDWIENQEENLIKMHQISDKWQFLQTLLKSYTNCSSNYLKELMVEANSFFLWKEGVNEIKLRHKRGTQLNRKYLYI